jgi:hypothetical protein
MRASSVNVGRMSMMLTVSGMRTPGGIPGPATMSGTRIVLS